MNTLHYNMGRLEQRKIDELIGLCTGIVADGIVNVAEARFIYKWLESNPHAAKGFPGKVLIARLGDMLRDDRLDDEESVALLDLLKKTCGMQDGTDLQIPASNIPYDDPPPKVIFLGQAFVFTGIFAYGPRVACEQATRIRGAVTQPRVTEATNYLVVGSLVSQDWIHATFGRMIEHALEIKKAGKPLVLIFEDHWAEALVNTPEKAGSPWPESPQRLAGKHILFTGEMYGISRSTAQKWVEQLGGVVVSGVSTGVSYVVCGESPGSKLNKALSLEIPVIDREEFLKLVGKI